MPDHDSTCELSKSAAHPCPHVPCSSCSQRQMLHHAYGVVESKDRGWIAQFSSVPCSSGNKSRFLWLAAKGCLWAHLSLPVYSPSLSRAPPVAKPKVLQSPGSPQALPHVTVVLSIALHFTLSVPVNSIFCIYSLSFCCQASKKIFYVLSQLLSTSTPLNPSNLFWPYFCHQLCHILCQIRPITKLLKLGALLRYYGHLLSSIGQRLTAE